MDDYVSKVETDFLDPWMADTWRGMPLPRDVLYVPHGSEGFEECLDLDGAQAHYTSQSYEYCGADRIVYVGQDMLWALYTKAGDAGPAAGLAHEYGHHVQSFVGVPSPETASESIRHENQADCIAGGWLHYADQHNELEKPDDIEDINALIPLIASAEGPDRDHGTLSERTAALNSGFQSGITACNDFYPATPLV